MSQKAKPREEFSFERKKKMAGKISTMTNKEHLRKIRDIIFSENQNVSTRKNNDGYLMYFQNYTNDTYYKIEKYLNKIDNEKLEKQTRAFTETSDRDRDRDQALSSEDPNIDYTLSRSRLRYSNMEKRLMKRIDYEKKITESIRENNEIEDSEVNESESENENENQIENKNQSENNSSPEQPIKLKRLHNSQKENKIFPELPSIGEKKAKAIFSLSSSHTKTKKN